MYPKIFQSTGTMLWFTGAGTGNKEVIAPFDGWVVVEISSSSIVGAGAGCFAAAALTTTPNQFLTNWTGGSSYYPGVLTVVAIAPGATTAYGKSTPAPVKAGMRVYLSGQQQGAFESYHMFTVTFFRE